MAALYDTHIISERLLKHFSNLTRNVDIGKVMPYVSLAEDFYITDILGDPLMDELREQIATDTLTDENKALLIKVAPVLALYTEFLSLRGLAYTITAKGITKEKSENSESISEKELGEWRIQIENDAKTARERLVKFLCTCDNYPLWRPDGECDCEKYRKKVDLGDLRKRSNPLVFIPKKKKGCPCDDGEKRKPNYVEVAYECMGEWQERSGGRQYWWTGWTIITLEDLNPFSVEYHRTKTEIVDDGRCPEQYIAPDYQLESQTCRQIAYEPSGVEGNDGWRIDLYVDKGGHYESYTETVTDTVMCPLPDTDPVWEFVSSECETAEYSTGAVGRDGKRIDTFVDRNVYSEKFNTTKTVIVEDVEKCPPESTEPIWELVEEYCQEKTYQSGAVGLNGVLVQKFKDVNPFSESVGRVVVVEKEDTEKCPLPDSTPKWELVDETCEQKEYEVKTAPVWTLVEEKCITKEIEVYEDPVWELVSTECEQKEYPVYE